MTRITLLTGLLGVVSLFLVAFFWEYPLLLLLVLFILSGGMILIQSKQDRKVYFLLWIVCGFAGAAAESIAIWKGAWYYSESSYLIPFWLIPLWGIASIFMVNLNKVIKKLTQ